MKRADFLKIMSLSALGPFFGRCSEPESGQKMDAAVMQKKWIWSKPDISLDDAHWKRRFDLMRSSGIDCFVARRRTGYLPVR